MKRLALALVALSVACAASAASAAPVRDGFIDPAWRSPAFPPGPLRVVGGITAISAINANDGTGLSPLEFSQVTIRGVVQIPPAHLDPFDRAQRTPWFWVHDGTGGIAVAGLAGSAIAAVPGDSVEVNTFVLTQPLGPLRGTRTLDFSAVGIGTATVISSGRPLQPAQTVSAGQIRTQGATVEGSLVSVGGLSLVDPAEWPATGASAFVRVTDGVDTIRIRVDEDSDLDGTPPPADGFRVSGFVAQDDAAGIPYASGHFVYPRAFVTVAPAAVVSGTAGVSLEFAFTPLARRDTVEVAIPATWTWTAPGDLTLAGPGFAGATTSFTGSGGGWTVRVTGATLGGLAGGSLTVGSLTAPGAGETSVFATRAAAALDPMAPVCASPGVEVIPAGSPGEIVINELYPRTTDQLQGVERSEFIELRNRTDEDIPIAGWTLSDIGRTPQCVLGARWAFPAGAVIPAQGFVVVCQTARDPAPQNGGGFVVDFPGVTAAVYEMYDPTAASNRPDDPATPNMVLADPGAGDDRIYLLGGPNTNAGQCESPNVPGLLLPFEELVVLRNAFSTVIDAVEYREPGPCTSDLCGPSDPAGTGANDAYAYGAPKVGHTLGRDAASTDTDDSSADLRPSSTPTPGAANVPVDSVAPVLAIPAANIALSASILEVRFDEPVDAALATDPGHYSVTTASRAALPVLQILPDPSEPLAHFFVVTDALPTGGEVTLGISGITDIVFDGGSGNSIDTTVVVPVPRDAYPICAVQATDEVGFSPLVGDTVLVAGYVTILPTSTERFSIWVQEPGSSGCGANVFSFDIPAELAVYGLEINDLVVIHGRVTEFISASSGSGSVTELASYGNTDFLRFLVRGLPGPDPREVTTGGANDESLEGTLVRTRGTVINSNALAAWIDDGSGAVQVFQNFSSLDLTRFTVGDRLDVTGVITQFDATEPYFEGYELVPQTQESIVLDDSGFTDHSPSVEVARRVLVPSLGETMDITVRTPRRADVIAEIYDSAGRKVTTFYDGLGLGEMRFSWDGRDQGGQVVPPGVYLCHVRATPLDGGSIVKHTAPIVVGLRLEGGEAAR